MADSTRNAPATLTVHQAARVFQVQPSTVYGWVRSGELPSLRLGGRIRIPAAKLAGLLGVTVEELTVGTAPPAAASVGD